MIDILIFTALVNFQYQQSYAYSYCFYVNLSVSIVTFICSLLLNLDEIINEFKIWQVKTEKIKYSSI
jgi:hypothetical protein